MSFPTPLPIIGEPVSMDLADLDGDKTPEILYVSRTKPGGDSFELRAGPGEEDRFVRVLQVG